MFGEDAVELLELLHEVLFSVEASSGIDDEGVGVTGGGSADGVVTDGGGVGTVGAGDDRGMESFAPEFELFDGGGAEGIAGGEDGGEVLLLEVVGEFGGGGGFSGAVDADDRDDGELVGEEFEGGIELVEAFFDLGTGELEDIDAGFALGFEGLAGGGDDGVGDGESEVSAEEGGFEFLECIGGEFGGAGDDSADFVDEPLVGFLETGFKAIEEAHGIG